MNKIQAMDAIVTFKTMTGDSLLILTCILVNSGCASVPTPGNARLTMAKSNAMCKTPISNPCRSLRQGKVDERNDITAMCRLAAC